MSALEELAIPILTPIIKGQNFTITPKAQEILARWISMKSIVAEHNHPPDAVTGFPERDRLRRTGQLPNNYEIWIARCGVGGWETGYKREIHTVSLTRSPSPEEIASKNIQEIAFGIGELFVHIVHTTVVGLNLNVQVLKPEAVIQLWPGTGLDIAWPPDHRLSVQAAFNVASILRQLAKKPNVLWLPAPLPQNTP